MRGTEKARGSSVAGVSPVAALRTRSRECESELRQVWAEPGAPRPAAEQRGAPARRPRPLALRGARGARSAPAPQGPTATRRLRGDLPRDGAVRCHGAACPEPRQRLPPRAAATGHRRSRPGAAVRGRRPGASAPGARAGVGASAAPRAPRPPGTDQRLPGEVPQGEQRPASVSGSPGLRHLGKC